MATKARVDVVATHKPSIALEQARDARARAWRFVFDCWEQKKAANENGGEERVREEKHVSRSHTTH